MDLPIWKSNRGIPLVYVGETPFYPILTVENKVIWDSLFVIHPDGRVVNVTMRFLTGFENSWHQNVPNPQACEQYADEMGFEWDETSLDMIYGRFAREVLEMEISFKKSDKK